MRTRTRTILAGAALVAVLGGGAAWATGAVSSIVSADGTINGCYRAASGSAEGQGQLRVVAAGEECRKNELAIDWNHRGPEGDRGPQGLQGLAGSPGPPGAKGDTGAQGATGADGVAGQKGADGAAGPKGEDGPTGARGTDGISVTSEAVPAGNVHCPAGGSSFTSASGATYACNGAPGSVGGAGSIAAKGTIEYLAQATYPHFAVSRGVASASFNEAQGVFTVNYTTPAPCGPGAVPIPVVSFRIGTLGQQEGEVATVGYGPNSFTVKATTPSGAILNSGRITFTFIAAC